MRERGSFRITRLDKVMTKEIVPGGGRQWDGVYSRVSAYPKLITTSSGATLRSAGGGHVIDLNNEIMPLIGACILGIRNSATRYSGKDARDPPNMVQLDDPRCRSSG